MINTASDIPNAEIALTEIFEGPASIVFDPPLVLDVYLYKNEKSENTLLNINFDFGLSHDFGLNPFYIKDIPLDDWTGRAKRIVEFELFHSFFHPSEDPNFSVLNWALFGNLAHRVICREELEIGDGNTETEVWWYDEKFQKVYQDSIVNLIKGLT